MKHNFAVANTSKANFDDIYTRDDPRDYFSVLGSYDYMIPDLAEPVLRQLLAACIQRGGGDQAVLDVGCSYGINAAVHRFPLSFGTLRNRYAHHAMMAPTSRELAQLDRHFYVSRPEADVRAAPLDQIVTIASGRNRPVGTRYVQVETERGLQIALEP